MTTLEKEPFVAQKPTHQWFQQRSSSKSLPQTTQTRRLKARISSEKKTFAEEINNDLQEPFTQLQSEVIAGGQGGIRTHGDIAATHAFQACSFDHSDTCPLMFQQYGLDRRRRKLFRNGSTGNGKLKKFPSLSYFKIID